MLAKCREALKRIQEAASESNYTAEDHSNNVRTSKKITLYSVKGSATISPTSHSTYGCEICQRTIHVSQKEVPELHRV
jgi:hypothetical protein